MMVFGTSSTQVWPGCMRDRHAEVVDELGG